MDQSSKPYRGIESYGVEDAPLFFGRDAEADELVARILANRVTVLHATSGAGKTSLLNARIIPGLEARCVIPIRILPRDNPAESARQATLQYLLPPPEAEVHVLKAAVRELAGGNGLSTLAELLDAYDALERSASQRRQLIMPVRYAELGLEHSGPEFFVEGTPVVQRLLRASTEIASFDAHVAAIRNGPSNVPGTAGITADTPVRDLIELLSSSAVRTAYRGVVQLLDSAPGDLLKFYRRLIRSWGSRLPSFSLALIFDQFEEVFTRFADAERLAPGAEPVLHWSLRDNLFHELERIYTADEAGDQRRAIDPKSILPIRFVFSLRDEWVAKLDPIHRFVWDLNDTKYHLAPLERDAAKLAIEEPAGHYGFAYEAACVGQVLDELTTEGKYVEPVHLQIVCDKIWKEFGAQIIGNSAPEDRVVTATMLATIEGTQGILKSFFREYLEHLDSDEERFDTLEMLDLLITGSGTRNIVEETSLVRLPFRDPVCQAELLEKLVGRAIVRRERRARGRLVEITHEFLIEPIRRALAEALHDENHSRCRWAVRTLQGFMFVDYRADIGRLPAQPEVENLDRFRTRLTWEPWSLELMLRGVIRHELRGDRKREETIRYWVDRFEQDCQDGDDAAALLDSLSRPETQRTTLALDELRLINQSRKDLLVTPEHAELVLRSELQKATPEDAPDVAYWAGRLCAL